MVRFFRYLFVFLAVAVFVPVSSVQAQLKLELNRGVVEPMPIAINVFYAGDENTLSTRIPGVVSVNLEGSGLFKPVNKAAFVQSVNSIEADGIRFGEWRATGAQALLTGRVMPSDGGRTRVEFRLWDVFSEKQLAGMAYTTTERNWRRIAHIISDEIYKRLTGENGYFDTRIVYVAESGPPTRRKKRLAIMDQDGANHKYLTDGRSLVMTPRFSPTEQKITYMSYASGGPAVYVYDISTGSHKKLGNFPGMTFAPRFSPDGQKVIMSQAKNGNSEIYTLDLRTRRQTRLTNNSAIDTAPSFSPNGRQVVFESDRGGSQQLYTMDANGGNVQRITFGKGSYGNPVWSPRGDLIAFTRIYKGKFYIGVIRPDGAGERLITNAYHVEGPTWSPNGRVLSYFKERPIGPKREKRQAKIYTVDITGYNERWLQTPMDGSDPAWSPLNP